MARKENPYAYHLIDEEMHYSGHHEESGWDTDHRGAGGPYPGYAEFKGVKSIGNEFPSFRRRNITEEVTGVITFECCLQIKSGDGLYFGFWGDKGDEKEAFVLRQNASFVYAGSKPLYKIDNAMHYLKFVIDIDSGKVRVHLDGKFLSEEPFTGKARTICRVEFGYEAGSVGETIIHAEMEMYKNYLFCDAIIPKYEGNLPEEYEIEKNGKAIIGRRRYSPNSLYSTYYAKANSNTSTAITRRFDRASGNVCFEMKYHLPKKGAMLTVSLESAGTETVSVYDEFVALCCKDGVLRNHSGNVWQTLRIEADTNTNTALIRLNGKVCSVITFDNDAEYIDAVKIALVCDKALEFEFSDLKAFIIPPYPADYVPEPVIPKKKGDYYVGMNICSLWREGSHYGWDCITPFPENKPLLGYYDEGVTETADWEIKWMAEHGLDFQAYCWYASENDKPMMKTKLSEEIHYGHMLAKYSDKVKFALMWEADTGKPQSFEAVRDYFVPYFIDYFFSDPRYMHIDGTAIMSIYSPDKLARDLGGPHVARKCFDYLRSEVKKLGYKDLVILCCGDNTPIYKECGIDGVHAYNWGIEGYDVEFTKNRVLGNIREGSTHTVPTVSMGYNHTGWTGIRTPVLEPCDMVTLLEWSRDEILSTYEKDSWKSKLLMLSTWNEYGEGTYMMPAGVHGFGYLDALRTVFREDVPHADIVPNQDQLDRICILHPQDRILLAPHDELPPDTTEYPVIKKYEFKTEEDLKKWEFHNIASYEIKDGRLFGHSNATDPYGADPHMILHDDEFLPISTEKIGKIVAHCRTYKPGNSTCCIQHSYMFEPGKWYPTQTARLSVPDKVVPLVIEPASFHKFPWHETLYGFRFDPVWREGGFELESIEFYAAPPHRILKINGRIVDLKHNPIDIDGVTYISFDTKSDLKKLPKLYYEWNEALETLKIYGIKNAELSIGSDIAIIDGKEVKMARRLEYYDGVPHIQADIFCEIVGFDMEIDDVTIFLTDK